LLLIAYRLRGIDNPRAWIEGLERRFAYATVLRFHGGILLALALVLLWFLKTPSSAVGWIAFVCWIVAAIVGLSLLALQNHARHLIIAGAESSDQLLRITSIVIVLAGLALAVLPFFIS
jgi:uncharacterized protein YjeT (DUF2065 family)